VDTEKVVEYGPEPQECPLAWVFGENISSELEVLRSDASKPSLMEAATVSLHSLCEYIISKEVIVRCGGGGVQVVPPPRVAKSATKLFIIIIIIIEK
jgi:hypothetical protein